MANQRISAEKRAMILAAICEGLPMSSVTRMFRVGKHGVSRVVAETGEALADYMDKNFRDIPVSRLALDEAWQYVGIHGQRMEKKEAGKGDFWLWAGIDSDTKLIVSFKIGRRDWNTSEMFIEDIASRITGPVQIATDPHRSYVRHIPVFFGERGEFTYGVEKKIFHDPRDFDPTSYPARRKNGVPKIVTAEREAVFGEPYLATTTTCHIERFFLTMRQELKRYQRLGLGYSKDLGMHKAATALIIGTYNLVRRHHSLGSTPAQAAGIEEKAWTMVDVVRVTDAYLKAKDDAKFEAAFATLENL